MTRLSQDEQDIVDTVHEFVEREVRPVVRDLEHANTYPEKLIDQFASIAAGSSIIVSLSMPPRTVRTPASAERGRRRPGGGRSAARPRRLAPQARPVGALSRLAHP